MLAQRLRRRPNIKTSLFQRVVFAGTLIYKSAIEFHLHLIFNNHDNYNTIG